MTNNNSIAVRYFWVVTIFVYREKKRGGRGVSGHKQISEVENLNHYIYGIQEKGRNNEVLLLILWSDFLFKVNDLLDIFIPFFIY